jgi:diacylglycerol O-acyltransferase / wax synthase
MPDRLTALDAAFLNTEHTGEPMHVAGLYIFDGHNERTGRREPLDLYRLVEARLPLVPRYRQRCVPVPFGLGHPVWIDDPDFDLSYHVRHAALPEPGGMRELLDFVARIHERPLDRRRPLWEMYLIEGLAGERIATYTKVHHAMVDGIAGIDLATVLYDDGPDGRRLPPRRRWQPPPLRSGRRLIADVASEAAGAGLRGGHAALRHPAETTRRALAGLRGTASVQRLSGMLLPAPDSPFNAPVGPHRRIALADISLVRVKMVKNALSCTVNDVVLAIVGEAVQHYLAHRRIPHHDLSYRVMVPVSVRNESEHVRFGNRVAAMFLDLPVGPMPVHRRLTIVRDDMRRLKEEHQVLASEELITMVSWVPATLHALAGPLLLEHQRSINFVVSNVPGPQRPLYAGGSRLLETYPLLPVTMRIAMNICVSSYCGNLYFGLVADRDNVPDIDVLADGISRGLDRLERTTSKRATTATATAEAGVH